MFFLQLLSLGRARRAQADAITHLPDDSMQRCCAAAGFGTGLEPVYGLNKAALGCNRDEWGARALAWANAHAWARVAQSPDRTAGRLCVVRLPHGDANATAFASPQPKDKRLLGRSAALRRLPIARAMGGAPRLASHPDKVLARPRLDRNQVLRLRRKSWRVRCRGKPGASGQSAA